jgi:hypothetical protein
MTIEHIIHDGIFDVALLKILVTWNQGEHRFKEHKTEVPLNKICKLMVHC